MNSQSKNIKSAKTDLNVSKLIDAGLSTVDTVVSTFENPVDGIINKLPNTVAKFVDAMGSTKPVDGKPEPIISGPITKGSKDEQFVEALKQKMPTVQLQTMPSAFANEYKAPPLTVTDSFLGKLPCTKVSGSVVLEAVGTGTVGGLYRHRSVMLNPYELGGQVASIGANYQRHLWLSVGLFYIPFVSTTIPGDIILTFQNSTNSSYTPTTNLNHLSQRTNFIMGSCYKGLSLPLQAEFKQQYNLFATRTSDSKFYADWCFEAWTYQCPHNITVGVFGLTYELCFFSRIEDPTLAVQSLGQSYSQFLSMRTEVEVDTLLPLFELILDKYSEMDTVKIRERRFTSFEDTKPSLDLICSLLDWGNPQPGSRRHRFLEALSSLLRGESRYLLFIEKLERDTPVIILLLNYILCAYEHDDDPFLYTGDNLLIDNQILLKDL